MMTGKVEIFPREAEILARYLIGKECNQRIADDFSEAVSKLNISLTEKQSNVYSRMLQSTIFLKMIDGGLAITNPQSIIRKRIFVMLALLEASEHYTDDFLPQQRSFLYFIQIGFRVVFGFLVAVPGVILIKILKFE